MSTSRPYILKSLGLRTLIFAIVFMIILMTDLMRKVVARVWKLAWTPAGSNSSWYTTYLGDYDEDGHHEEQEGKDDHGDDDDEEEEEKAGGREEIMIFIWTNMKITRWRLPKLTRSVKRWGDQEGSENIFCFLTQL